MPVGGAMIGGDAAPQTPPSFPILASPYSGHDSGSYDPRYPSCGHYSGSYDSGYPSCDYDSCSDDSGYPACDYDFCSDNSGKLSIPDQKNQGHRINATIPFTRAKGKISSWDEQRQRETPIL